MLINGLFHLLINGYIRVITHISNHLLSSWDIHRLGLWAGWLMIWLFFLAFVCLRVIFLSFPPWIFFLPLEATPRWLKIYLEYHLSWEIRDTCPFFRSRFEGKRTAHAVLRMTSFFHDWLLVRRSQERDFKSNQQLKKTLVFVWAYSVFLPEGIYGVLTIAMFLGFFISNKQNGMAQSVWTYKMGPPNCYFRGFFPSYTHLQPWFFIGFAGVISLPYN